MRLRYAYLALILTFLLGSRNGFVALWKIPDPEPVYVFPYRISALPPADQKKLKTGITVESYDELTRLLEDYLS